MAREFKGSLQGEGLRIALVVAKFNQFVTQRLEEGARAALAAHGVRDEDVTVTWVPGSFEIPVVAKTLAKSGRYHAVVCLGCVIKGETPHFDYVAGEAAKGVAQAASESGVPVLFGVLTANTMEQAIDRAGGKMGNRGYDAAVAAIEMANLMKVLKGMEGA